MSKQNRKPGERVAVGRVKTARENEALAQAVGALESGLKRADISKSALARRLGVTLPAVSTLFDPQRNLTIRTFARTADALGFDLRVRLIPRVTA